MSTESHLFSFKITLIGEGGVGKTSLIQRLMLESFKENYIKTIGANFYKYEYSVNSDSVQLILWDIAGQDDFNFLKPSFLKDSRASIIVYSLEENELGEDSFNHILDWFQDVRRLCGDIPVFLFANKSDLVDSDKIDQAKIQTVVKELNLYGSKITSAKTGAGVKEAFHEIIHYLYKKNAKISINPLE